MSTSSVKERPILMNAEMVRAVLDGRKTQTRRIVKPQLPGDYICKANPERIVRGKGINPSFYLCDSGSGVSRAVIHPDGSGQNYDTKKYFTCPFGAPGERLWVREAFTAINDPGCPRHRVLKSEWDEEAGETTYWTADYRADGNHTRIMDKAGTRKWRPSIHMPRWASRLTLEITGVRVERLQDISEEDAKAEGCEGHRASDGYDIDPFHDVEPREEFQELWTRINGPDSWAANPWLWVIEFQRLETKP